MAEPIIRFSADRTAIRPGECVTFRWSVEGVQAVYFFQDGERPKEHGVVGQGEQQICLSQTATYCLRVTKSDGSAEVRKITVQVRAPRALQIGDMLSVDKAEIQPGECVTFRWRVQGVKAVYFHAEGERWQDHGVVGEGEQQACPAQTTTYCLRVVKPDNSVDVRKMTVEVRAQTGSEIFTVDRDEIRPGECVTFRWRAEGIKAVYFHPEGEHWQDHGVVGEGQQQICPAQTTTYCLRIVKPDNSVEIHYLSVEVM